MIGDAAVGKSSLLMRLTDQRFLANPDPTVSVLYRDLTHCPKSLMSPAAVGRRVWVEVDINSGRGEGCKATMYVRFSLISRLELIVSLRYDSMFAISLVPLF